MAKKKKKEQKPKKRAPLPQKRAPRFFLLGKVRIKVSEHFAQDGKPLDSLLEDVIQHAAAAS